MDKDETRRTGDRRRGMDHRKKIDIKGLIYFSLRSASRSIDLFGEAEGVANGRDTEE